MDAVDRLLFCKGITIGEGSICPGVRDGLSDCVFEDMTPTDGQKLMPTTEQRHQNLEKLPCLYIVKIPVYLNK